MNLPKSAGRLLFGGLAAGTLLAAPIGLAGAAGYSAELVGLFADWCLKDQANSQNVCSCAIDKSKNEIAAADLKSFLAGGANLSAASQRAGASALKVVGACSGIDTQGTIGGAIKKFGGFGK